MLKRVVEPERRKKVAILGVKQGFCEDYYDKLNIKAWQFNW